MICPVKDGHFHVDHVVSGNNTVVQCFFNAHFSGLDIFLWYRAAYNGIDKLKALAALVGSHPNPHVTILTMAPRLSNVLSLSLRFARNCLPVGNLWPSHVGLYLKLAEHTVHDN